MASMRYSNPNPYRWQDHVVTPRRAATSLLATILVVFLVSAAAMLAYSPSVPAASPAQAARPSLWMQNAPQTASPGDPDGLR